LGVSRETLSRVLNSQASISAEMDLRLSKALHTTRGSWYGMQADYDLWRTKQRLGSALNKVEPMISNFILYLLPPAERRRALERKTEPKVRGRPGRPESIAPLRPSLARTIDKELATGRHRSVASACRAICERDNPEKNRADRSFRARLVSLMQKDYSRYMKRRKMS
jgi:transcriptional regulator with XRE-family HTH domain